MKKEEFNQMIKDILTIKKHEINQLLKDKTFVYILLIGSIFLGFGIFCIYKLINEMKEKNIKIDFFSSIDNKKNINQNYKYLSSEMLKKYKTR